jgi:hypothetical protein
MHQVVTNNCEIERQYLIIADLRLLARNMYIFTYISFDVADQKRYK